jgi:hypothetical protein
MPPAGPPSPALNTSDTISNLLIGQKGVHRLFDDFTSTLSAKEKALHDSEAKIEELEQLLRTTRDQLEQETALRVAAQNDRETALRDDGSAAKVVERYMTFTQKTHATVHMHLDNLRARSAATQTSLRDEIAGLRAQLSSEHDRAEKLRIALDEMSEGLSREAAGRRREVGLRLKMLAVEEKRERRIEIWLDKVRRARAGPEGAVVEPDLLEALLDEGVEAVEKERPGLPEPKAWKRIIKRKPEPVQPRDDKEESIARVLLAEELVNTLVQDLQAETERRVELEKQRVEWLAKDAVNGVVPASFGPSETVFEIGDHGEPEGDAAKAQEGEGRVDGRKEGKGKSEEGEEDGEEDLDKEGEKLSIPAPPRTPSPLPETPPLLPRLRDLFEPLTDRYTPLQKALHDLSHSLTALRNAPMAFKAVQRKPMLNLSRRPDHTIQTLLDSIHEVIEDARVDVEIALADEERVFRGFEALLGVGKSGVVQGKEVISDAEEYIADRKEWEGYSKLETRVADIEHDITGIKRVVHESEGLETGEEGSTRLSELDLKTVSLPTRHPVSPLEDGERRRGSNILSSVGNVGRSFSSGLVSAPRRVGSFAGGLYRPKDKEGGEEEKVLLNGKTDDDGVE